jgi:two-component system, NarL family, sensor histidine kinase BarA
MLKRIRQLHISLAAKCQLLFGAAVVLIIAAALFVPWQRMEQLTEQLNERSARTLIEFAIRSHLANPREAGGILRGGPTTAGSATEPAAASNPAAATITASTSASLESSALPGTRPTVRVAPPTTAPIGDDDDDDQPMTPPRLMLVSARFDDSNLTRFERRAVRRLLEGRNPTVSETYETPDGGKGFRFARADASCASCHVAEDDSWVAQALALERPTTTPTTAPATPATPATRLVEASNRASATTRDAQQQQQQNPHDKLVGLVSVDIPSQIETRQLLLNRVFILTAGLLAGTLAIIVFYLITTRLILQPVRVLQETAEKVSEGNLDIRSDISTGDEFQQLSETFNTMLANLKLSADQLRAVNKSLDIKLGQLSESNVALYEANRLKSEFLANVSHELRTPLNSILGFADLLKDSAAQDAKSTRYVQNILSSGRNLLDLINDLLDLAKIEAGRMEIRSEPLSLNDLFEGLTSVLKPLSEQKQLAIVISVANDVPIIQTDPGKLQQVLYNFLSNAIKFSPPGSRIDLRAQREPASAAAENTDNGNGGAGGASAASPGGVRILVTDRGPGIPPEQHEVIFEKFRQIDASHTRTHSGTGLGLAISKELTALLGGTIGVDSTPGRGSTFWVVLPFKNVAGTQDLRARLVLS